MDFLTLLIPKHSDDALKGFYGPYTYCLATILPFLMQRDAVYGWNHKLGAILNLKSKCNQILYMAK